MRQAGAEPPQPLALNWRSDRPIKKQGTRTGRSPKTMPTLFRFVVTLGVLVAICYGAMFALATFVQPKKAEMTVRVPLDKLAR